MSALNYKTTFQHMPMWEELLEKSSGYFFDQGYLSEAENGCGAKVQGVKAW